MIMRYARELAAQAGAGGSTAAGIWIPWPVLGFLAVLLFVLILIPLGHRYGVRGIAIASIISATAALLTATAQVLPRP
jgi:Na+-driven multidrug efflux pump